MPLRLCPAVISIAGCLLASCTPEVPMERPAAEVLDRYRQCSVYTDPGAHARVFDELPQPLDELCALIKQQLIHPFEAGAFIEELPEGRGIEDRDFPTVSMMLEELLRRDDRGLVMEREPKNRLIVACVHHSMLLASILRHRGIPVRIRAGFAKYIGGRRDLRVSHVVCEVWDAEREQWILVDPDRQRIDFARNDFEFATETWQMLRNDDLGSESYVSSYDNEVHATVHLLCHDLSYVLVEERPYWEDPPIVSTLDADVSALAPDQRRVLDRVARLLHRADYHLDALSQMQTEHESLRYTDE